MEAMRGGGQDCRGKGSRRGGRLLRQGGSAQLRSAVSRGASGGDAPPGASARLGHREAGDGQDGAAAMAIVNGSPSAATAIEMVMTGTRYWYVMVVTGPRRLSAAFHMA